MSVVGRHRAAVFARRREGASGGTLAERLPLIVAPADAMVRACQPSPPGFMTTYLAHPFSHSWLLRKRRSASRRVLLALTIAMSALQTSCLDSPTTPNGLRQG